MEVRIPFMYSDNMPAAVGHVGDELTATTPGIPYANFRVIGVELRVHGAAAVSFGEIPGTIPRGVSVDATVRPMPQAAHAPGGILGWLLRLRYRIFGAPEPLGTVVMIALVGETD